MKRSPMPRARANVKPRRSTPRQRVAPRWTAAEWEDANALLYARAGGRCECCDVALSGRAERHHRQRRRDGGDRLANLLLLAPECHAWVTTHPAVALDRGLIVSAHAADPAQVPVLWRGAVWSLLDDAGGRVPCEGLRG